MPTATAVHRRDHRSVLATAEKRLLVAIAASLPQRINSDHLSGLALAAMVLVGGGFTVMRIAPAGAAVVVVGLILNWFGDSLDGTLARVRRHERPRFGFYVDHVIDLIGATALFAGLAVSGLMAPTIALAVLVGYLLMCAESFLATHATGVFRMSFIGVGPTELRILLAVGALRAAQQPFVSVPVAGTQRLFDVGGVIAAIGFAVALLISAGRQTLELYRAEPIPQPEAVKGSSRSPEGLRLPG